jgi:hypothetical protein
MSLRTRKPEVKYITGNQQSFSNLKVYSYQDENNHHPWKAILFFDVSAKPPPANPVPTKRIL